MRNKTEYDRFPIAKRGYEPQSVETHLDEIAVDHDRMLDEAAARIAALEVELEESRKQEEAVHLTILAATKTKEDMLEAARHQAAEFAANGRKEGDRIVTDARMQAFQLVTGAREEAGTIVREARAEAAAVSRVDEDTPIPDQGPSELRVGTAATHRRDATGRRRYGTRAQQAARAWRFEQLRQRRECGAGRQREGVNGGYRGRPGAAGHRAC